MLTTLIQELEGPEQDHANDCQTAGEMPHREAEESGNIDDVEVCIYVAILLLLTYLWSRCITASTASLEQSRLSQHNTGSGEASPVPVTDAETDNPRVREACKKGNTSYLSLLLFALCR